MKITISPIGLAVVMLIAINCLISFGKSNAMKKGFIILSSIFSIAGISGIIITRLQFITSLSRSASRRHFDSDFVSWAVTKFDYYVTSSIILIFLTIVILLYLLHANKNNKSGFFWENISIFVIVLMIVNLFVGVVYSLTTINKLFDIGYYIGILSISEIFALYIPLIVKRIILLKGNFINKFDK